MNNIGKNIRGTVAVVFAVVLLITNSIMPIGNIVSATEQVENTTPKAEQVKITKGDHIVGYEGQKAVLVSMFFPSNCEIEDETWQSDNTDVVEVNEWGSLKFISAGKATVTITTENGLTDSIQVTVLEIPEIKLGVDETVDISVDGSDAYFKFTPSKTATYAFYYLSGDDVYSNGAIYDSTGKAVAYHTSYRFKAMCELVEGETYLLNTDTVDEDGVYKVRIDEVVDKADSLEILAKESCIRYVDTKETFTAQLLPKLCLDEAITWSSSNIDIADIAEDGSVSFRNEGLVTITAESANGLKDSIEVEVKKEIPELELDTWNKIKIEIPGEYTCYNFIPEESGTYRIDIIGGEGSVSVTKKATSSGTVSGAVSASSAVSQIYVAGVIPNRYNGYRVDLEAGQSCSINSFCMDEVLDNYIIRITKYNASSLYNIGKFVYALKGNEAIVYSYLGKDEHVEIPAEIYGYSVNELGAEMFSATPNVSSVTIPESVSVISENTFDGCDGATIKCYAQSAALDFAQKLGMNYEIVVPEVTPTPVVTEAPTGTEIPVVTTEPSDTKLGDVTADDSIDARDALMILKYAAKLEDLNDIQKLAADINKDNAINAGDALKVLRIAARLE